MKTKMDYQLSTSIDENLSNIKEVLGNSSDLIIREIGIEQRIIPKAAIVFIDGIVDGNEIEEQILTPMLTIKSFPDDQKDDIKWADILKNDVIRVKAITETNQFNTMIEELLIGKTIILIDGFSLTLAADTSKWQDRALGPAQIERAVKGPSIGFTELKSTNLALLRRIVKNPLLRVQSKAYGSSTKTDISIVYLEDKVDHQVLSEVVNRLDQVNLKSVLEANYLEEILTKESKTIFPLINTTDRPDTVAACILEGKIAILVDGASSVLLLPVVFWQFFQTSDDYYFNYIYSSQRRFFRLIAFILSIYLPALYVAFTIFHPGFLPSGLLISILGQREAVPMPILMEVVIFQLLITVLNESSVRLSQSLVITVSIFGAIALGQATIDAQFVTSATLAVLSASYILQSMVPSMIFISTIILPLKLYFLLLSAILGLYGIFLGTLVLLLHLCSLRSFGVPYLSLLAPLQPHDQKDVILRGPIDEINQEQHQNKVRKEEYMKETTQ